MAMQTCHRSIYKSRRVGLRRRAFTLLEIMLVVLIIGMLATVGIVAIGQNLQRSRVSFTITTMAQIKGALTQYQMDYAGYPERLDALVPKYLEKLPKDGWKREFIYRPIGSSGTSEQPFDLMSYGKDGEQGSQDQWINVWTMDATNTTTTTGR